MQAKQKESITGTNVLLLLICNNRSNPDLSNLNFQAIKDNTACTEPFHSCKLSQILNQIAMKTASNRCHVQEMDSYSQPSPPTRTCSPFFPDNPMPPLGPGGPCWPKMLIISINLSMNQTLLNTQLL